MKLSSALALLVFTVSCTPKKSTESKTNTEIPTKGTFAFDADFIKKYKSAIVLSGKKGKSKVLVVGDYQARVMTSTATGDSGKSHGWVNYKLIESGKIPAHIYPVGGEDRFWLGPEGGQYSIFFKKDNPFDFEHWQTPALIDSEPFDLVSSDSSQATFGKKASVTKLQWIYF